MVEYYIGNFRDLYPGLYEEQPLWGPIEKSDFRMANQFPASLFEAASSRINSVPF
jgi:hypothetical protein